MKNKLRLIVTIITLSIFLFMTIGFAIYGEDFNIQGRVTFAGNGEVTIVSVDLVNSSNIDNPSNPEFTSDSINFNLNFTVESNSNLDDEYLAEYDITISNASFYDYAFLSTVFNPSIETTNNENLDLAYEVTGIEVGEIIPKLSSKTFRLSIYMYPKATGDYNVSGDSNVNLEGENEEPSGSIMASIPKNITLDLTNPTLREKVTVTIINTYESNQQFSFSLSNSNFKVVNSSGGNLGSITMNANSTQSYDIYIERKNVSFATNSQNTNLFFNSSDGTSSLGNIKILVTKDETLVDDQAPIISNVSATFVADNGKVNLNWAATDVSGIDHFIIEAIDSNDNVTTYTTNTNDTNYQVTGLSNGTYYFKVYGVDTKGFSGKTQATECTTSEGKCSRSTSATYTWVFTVTYNLTNITTNSSTEAIIGTTYTGIITAARNYSLRDTITVQMNGQTLTQGTGYSYSSSSGNIQVYNVSGNITITATGRSNVCLIEGTKILLANGKYKNIENITYNDLLSVWSYDSGSLTYEYPIWIEKESKTNGYQMTTFSDGSVLKTLNYHGIFSVTHNEFISVDDYDKFKVGTKVYKVENGKLKEVTIKKIETIYEEVNYYHVVSTRYYNIIADDFITTDGTVILSNLYGFDKNITWPKVRNRVISDKNNLYSYDELKDVLPYYMFIGLRAEEGKYLNNYGLDLNTFKYYLKNNQTNENMLLKVKTNKNNKRLWMVTTNYDKVLDYNKYLYEEGSYYELPRIIGVNKWYSTSENKYYKPGDRVLVNHGMHFISK